MPPRLRRPRDIISRILLNLFDLIVSTRFVFFLYVSPSFSLPLSFSFSCLTLYMEPYVIVCKCKEGTMIRRCSNSEKSRNRMYYCCPKSEATNGIWSWGCNHFLWEHKLVPQGWDNGGEAESSASGGKASPKPTTCVCSKVSSMDLESDEQKYPCPCGQGNLTIKTTQKQGKNHKRKYLTCPASKSGGEDCGFYSFLDELMWCRCGKGYCRNLFKNKNKYWCCPLKDTNDCGFRALVSQPSTGSPPATPQLPRLQHPNILHPATLLQVPHLHLQHPATLTPLLQHALKKISVQHLPYLKRLMRP